MKSGTKKTFLGVMLLVIVGSGVWYAVQKGWFEDRGPNNLPTAEERERMRAVEESSSRKDLNAKTGVGVLPPGTLPPTPTVESTATATPSESTTSPSL